MHRAGRVGLVGSVSGWVELGVVKSGRAQAMVLRRVSLVASTLCGSFS